MDTIVCKLQSLGTLEQSNPWCLFFKILIMHSFQSLFLALLGFLSLQVVCAATITYNWDIGWINQNPDNRQVRPVIAINGKWPSPQIVGNVGDNVIVNVNNNLGNQSLTIHWHGLHQTGNNANDGTPVVTQCPIIPGTNYTYTFAVGFYLFLVVFSC
jgi:iron transport multicopper oxidase